MKMDFANRSTMTHRSTFALGRALWLVLTVTLLGATAEAQVAVKGVPTGAVATYYWTLEEDATYSVAPGIPDPNTLAVSFHTSYMPVVASGDEGDSPFTAITSLPACAVPDEADGERPCRAAGKHYFLSVLPKDGYSNGGARFAAGDASVTVFVNKLPLPTAQITVFVFNDNQPINNAPDMPEEQGLAGFAITIDETAGNQVTDVFGNRIGTTYRDCLPAEVTAHNNSVEPDPCPYSEPRRQRGKKDPRHG